MSSGPKRTSVGTEVHTPSPPATSHRTTDAAGYSTSSTRSPAVGFEVAVLLLRDSVSVGMKLMKPRDPRGGPSEMRKAH